MAGIHGAPAVGLVGLHGYGASHLRELDRLAGLGQARLAACADVVAPGEEATAVLSRLGAEHFTDWRLMLGQRHDLDVLVVASPLHLHADMCRAAFERGLHVLVEKPPFVSLEDFDALSALASRKGALCQVGFQSTGSAALGRLHQVVAGSELAGPVEVVAAGQWRRPRSYWYRSRWAGREVLDGALVRDGAFSNPFAHAVMNCVLAAGAGTGERVAAFAAERYRANPIEVEDTGCMRVELAGGRSFVVALTLCAEEVEPPALEVRGPGGQVVWPYETDALQFSVGGRSWQEHFERQSLLGQLVDLVAGRPGAGLSCPLERSRPFVEVVELLHSLPVREVPPEHVRWHGEGMEAYPVLAGVGGAVHGTSRTGRLFSQLDVPWAVPGGPGAGCVTTGAR